jgi:hypothetical protein
MGTSLKISVHRKDAKDAKIGEGGAESARTQAISRRRPSACAIELRDDRGASTHALFAGGHNVPTQPGFFVSLRVLCVFAVNPSHVTPPA